MKNFSITSLFVNLIITCFTFTLVSCGDDDAGGGSPLEIKKSISGNIEKGPFVQGAKVTLYELNADLSQTGKLFRTQTVSDLGVFKFDNQLQLSSQYVEIETSGYFYNEVKGELSASQISLYALSDISSRNSVNVNLITHLEYGRVKKLLLNGLDFNAAKKQAEKELLACFAITEEISAPEAISVTDNNNSSAVLLAVSTIMLYNRSEAEFTQFISKFSTDFADNGMIDDVSIRDEVKQGQEHAHPSQVVDNMKEYYSKNGIDIQCDDFARYIDFNGDGVIDDKDASLDEEPVNQVVEETFWSTKENALAALRTCYVALGDFVEKQLNMEYYHTKKYSDGALWYDSAIENVTSSDNYFVRDAYRNAYKAVNYVNMMIDNKGRIVNLCEGDLGIVGQCYLMRAFLYYNIAMLWGDVPYMGHFDMEGALNVKTESQETVFQSALYDLDYAEDMLHGANPSTTGSKFQFSLDDVYMLRAEILLTQKRTIEAQDALSDVNISQYNASTSVIFAIAMDDGSNIPIYTKSHYDLLMKETNGTLTYSEWKNLACTEYGYWAVLKRLGVAQTVTGCSDDELFFKKY